MTISRLTGRYNTAGSAEGEFEPGSHDRVLKNLLGIQKKRDMEVTETRSYELVINDVVNSYLKNKHLNKITAKDISQMHKSWLGHIYIWAGNYRNVNMGKGNFQFASAHLIPKLMQEFEKDILNLYTPCHFMDLDKIAEALAKVHTEFILIHPFREGNGRLGRLISILMALQADLPVLNFEAIKGKKKKAYIKAVQAGLDRNYDPMKDIFKSVIRRTLRLYQKK